MTPVQAYEDYAKACGMKLGDGFRDFMVGFAYGSLRTQQSFEELAAVLKTLKDAPNE